MIPSSEVTQLMIKDLSEQQKEIEAKKSALAESQKKIMNWTTETQLSVGGFSRSAALELASPDLIENKISEFQLQIDKLSSSQNMFQELHNEFEKEGDNISEPDINTIISGYPEHSKSSFMELLEITEEEYNFAEREAGELKKWSKEKALKKVDSYRGDVENLRAEVMQLRELLKKREEFLGNNGELIKIAVEGRNVAALLEKYKQQSLAPTEGVKVGQASTAKLIESKSKITQRIIDGISQQKISIKSEKEILEQKQQEILAWTKEKGLVATDGFPRSLMFDARSSESIDKKTKELTQEIYDMQLEKKIFEEVENMLTENKGESEILDFVRGSNSKLIQPQTPDESPFMRLLDISGLDLSFGNPTEEDYKARILSKAREKVKAYEEKIAILESKRTELQTIQSKREEYVSNAANLEKIAIEMKTVDKILDEHRSKKDAEVAKEKIIQTEHEDIVTGYIDSLNKYKEDRTTRFGGKDRLYSKDKTVRDAFVDNLIIKLRAFKGDQKQQNFNAVMKFIDKEGKKYPGTHLQTVLNQIKVNMLDRKDKVLNQDEKMAKNLEDILNESTNKNYVKWMQQLLKKIDELEGFGTVLKEEKTQGDKNTVQNLAKNLRQDVDRFVRSHPNGIDNNNINDYKAFKDKFTARLHSENKTMNQYQGFWKTFLQKVASIFTRGLNPVTHGKIDSIAKTLDSTEKGVGIKKQLKAFKTADGESLAAKEDQGIRPKQ